MPAIAVALAGCLGAPADLDRGDDVPAKIMQSSSSLTIALAASVDDCLNCDLRGVFVALRALQSWDTSGPVPGLVVLAVTRSERDTLFFRQTLNRQRLAGRVERIDPRTARGIFDDHKLPAMYLIGDGRVMQEWEPSPDQAGIVLIGRSELVDAIAKHNHGSEIHR